MHGLALNAVDFSSIATHILGPINKIDFSEYPQSSSYPVYSCECFSLKLRCPAHSIMFQFTCVNEVAAVISDCLRDSGLLISTQQRFSFSFRHPFYGLMYKKFCQFH